MANEFKVKKGLIVDGTNTVLDIQGTQGQLFSVTDSLTGDLFSVSDISGVPILNVNSSGMSTFDGNVSIAEKLIHSSDTNTYIQFPGTNDKIVFTTNGSDHLTLDAAPSATFAGIINTSDGSAGTPAYNFTSHDGNGMYLEEYNESANKEQVSIATDGVRRLRVNEAGVWSDQNFYVVGDWRTFSSLWHATTGATGAGFRFENTADSKIALDLDVNGNAVFLGEIEGASLDINGNADISGSLTSGQLVATSSSLVGYFRSSGGTSYVQGAISIESSNADTPEARGQGVFMHNQGKDSTWYMGTRYNNADEWQLGRAAGASLATISATTANAFLKMTNAGNATFAGRVIIGEDAITTDKPGLVVGDTTNGGQITIRGGQPTLFFDKSGANNPVILTDGGTLTFKNGTIDSEGSDQLTLDTNGNTTFAGSVTATSLDINGNADISGNLDVGGILHITKANATAVLEIQGGLTTITAVDQEHGRLDFGANDGSVTGGIASSIRCVSEYSNGAHAGITFWTGQQSRSGGYLAKAMHIKNDLNVDIYGGLHINNSNKISTAGELEGGSLDINGNADITGNLTVNSGGIVLTQAYNLNLGVSGYDLKMPSSTTIALLTATENAILATVNAGVKLYFNNAVKLETVTGGANVTGTLTATADVIAYSDERLKENVQTLDGKKVLEMRGVSFDRLDDGKSSSGVIAQELEKVAPELVVDDGDYKGVAYGNLVGYLIEAVKDQQKQIDELKAMINGNS